MNKMKLGTKLMMGFVGVAVVTLALGIVGYYGTVKSDQAIKEIGDVGLPSVDTLLTIRECAENIRGTLRTLAITGLPVEIRQRQYDNLAKARATYEAAWKIYEPLPQTTEEATTWKEFVPAWEAWRAENNKFLELAKKFDQNGIDNPVDLGRRIEQFTKDHYILVTRIQSLLNDPSAVFEGGDDHTTCNAGKYLPTFKTENQSLALMLKEIEVPHQAFHEIVHRIKRLVSEGKLDEARTLYKNDMTKAMGEVFKYFEDMRTLVGDSIAIQALAEEQVFGPVTNTQRAAIALLDKVVQINRDVAEEEVASAEVQARLLKTVSVGASLGGVLLALFLGIFLTRSITKPINRIIDSLSSGADQVSSASGQVSSASQSLAEGASEQAAAIEETSSSLEEMSSMTKQNADNAAQANNLMSEAKVVVSRAGGSMKQMNETMAEISNSGQEIGKIIKTIDEIAFQTNLLALNAAVEAARAGEAGAGFAVVADEVRNLAMRAADAAKNTANLIEDTITRINQGTELVRTTDAAFTEVAASSGKVAELIGEIAAASAEQAQGIDQVNQAITQMDQVTQTNAASAEESASASEELNAQAESMLEVVGELMTLVAGSASATSHGRSTSHHGLPQKKQPRRAVHGSNGNGRAIGSHVPPGTHRGVTVVAPEDILPLDNDFNQF